MRTWRELWRESIEYTTRFRDRPDAAVTQFVVGQLYSALAELAERVEKLEAERAHRPPV